MYSGGLYEDSRTNADTTQEEHKEDHYSLKSAVGRVTGILEIHSHILFEAVVAHAHTHTHDYLSCSVSQCLMIVFWRIFFLRITSISIQFI